MEGMLILSIISLCLLHYSGAQTLQLQPPQQDQEKVLKKGLVQTCSAVGLGPGEDPQLTWTNSQGQIVTSTNSNDQVYVEGKGTQSLKLKIKAVRGEHDGKWICTGVIGGVTKTTFVTFSVWEDISFEGDLEQRPTIYTDALIKCVVSGTPQPKVTWAKDKKELNKGRYMPVGDGLKILNITKNDNGEYLCKAEIPGRGRYEERIITVEVKVPPTMTSPPKMTLGIKGSDVTMRCQASGDPTPTYKWYRDQRGSYVELNNGGRYEISKVEGTFKILRVEENDDGTYKCVATNLAASVEGTADIDVLVPPKIQPITAGEGSAMGTVKMHCVATGDPPPEMKWQKVGNYAPYTGGPNGQAIADKTNSRVTIVQTKDSDRTRLEMQIDRLEPSDIGNYTCFAHSQAGNDTMNSTLNVYFKPEFTNNPSDVAYSWSGAQHRNVTCIVDSNPAAVVTWERNGEVLKNNNTYTIHTVDRPRQVESNLTVVVDFTNAEYIFGDYVCKARNNKGEGQVVIDLRKADKPHPPSDVEVIRESQTWFRLRVGAPVQDGGMPVTGFQIIYSSPTDDRGQQTLYQKINTERINDDDARPKTSVDIRGLQPSSLYTILVSAITEVGHSDEYEFQRTTKRVSVPDPLEIRSKTVSETATVYKLTWEKPNDGGSRILRYVIRYRQVVVNDTTNQIIQVKGDYKERVETNPEATSYNLDKLVSKETYQIEVYAVNGVGNSEKRHIIVKTRSGPEAGGDAVVVDPGLSTGAIVGLVIIIFFILLLIVDVTCYFKNRCGIIMCVRENVCGAGAGDEDRQATLEDGDAKETQPLAEKEKPDMETKVGGAENQAGVVEDEKKQPLLDNEDKGPGDETATEAEEPEKMEEKEPEDKDERILEPQVEAGKEAQEAPSATTPEAEVKPGTESPTPPAEKA